MIRRLCASILLLVTALGLGGCFFENPLTSSPSKDINTWLLGVWEHRDEKDRTFRTTVTPLTGDRYTVWIQAPGKTKKDPKRWHFEAWISKVGRSSFLTLKCLESSGEVPVGGYLFAHYQVVDQNNVIIRIPQLSSAQNATSFELRKEMRQREKEHTLLPVSGDRWTRVSEVYWDQSGSAEQPYQPLRYPELP